MDTADKIVKHIESLLPSVRESLPVTHTIARASSFNCIPLVGYTDEEAQAYAVRASAVHPAITDKLGPFIVTPVLKHGKKAN